MKNNPVKNSLTKRVIGAIVLPLLLNIVIISCVSYGMMSRSLKVATEEDMKNVASLALNMYDAVYEGEYGVEMNADTGEYRILKGENDITGKSETLEVLARDLDAYISVFCRNIRVLTTLKVDDVPYVNTKAPLQVQEDVLNNGQSKFYDQVDIAGTKCFVYYEPIKLKDGTIYGMIGVAQSSALITQQIQKNIWPVVLITLFATILVGVVINVFIIRLIRRIKNIDHFMLQVSLGNFTSALPSDIYKDEDEITNLARNCNMMRDSIRKLVEFDALTNLYNRRFGDKKLAEIMIKAHKHNSDFAVAICDIDFFKKVNDTYGHEAGDEILKNVAAQLAKGMGGNGSAVRWGGEEFLLLFDHSNVDQAREVLQSILDNIRAMETVFGGQVIKVTMSMGVVAGNINISADENVKMADENLYYAKEHGRNQIRG